jgi:hypothetical protein
MLAVAMIPAPWIAAELGWFVAEFGRQPWTVDGVLPTAMSVSPPVATELLITLAGLSPSTRPVHRRDGPDGQIHPQGTLPGRRGNRRLGCHDTPFAHP